MSIQSVIKDDLILIVPSNIKSSIIEKISQLENIFSYNIFSIEEIKKSIIFDFDIKAISYIVNNYKVKVKIANEYIEAMYYIENKKYDNNKLDMLVSIKNELIENKLLKFDENIKTIFKGKNIVVYGFDTLTLKEKFVLDKIGQDYKIIAKEYNKKDLVVYGFETLEDEVNALCINISKLLLDGVDINNIKIANVGDEYLFTIDRYFKMFNIPINLNIKYKLFDIPAISWFYNDLLDSNNYQQSLDNFKEKYGENDLYNQLISILNDFVDMDDKDTYQILKERLKEAHLPYIQKDNAIEIIDLDNFEFDDNLYVFALSINQGVYPRTYRDDRFINDKESSLLGIDTTEDLNNVSQFRFEALIYGCKNLVLSYKKRSSFNSFSRAYILSKYIDEKKENKFEFDMNTSFSVLRDKLYLASIYDSIDAKNENEYINNLYSNYDIDYQTYSNSYKPIDKNTIEKYINNELANKKMMLSYSSLNTYYQCAFKYYLKYFLHLSIFSDSVGSNIGNVFHKVLEQRYKDKSFNFDDCYDLLANDEKYDVVTKLYLKKLKENLRAIIDTNDEFFSKSKLNRTIVEREIKVIIDDPKPMVFDGKIDKIVAGYDNNDLFMAIIDYKTNPDEDFDMDNVEYGLNMQLPIYLYLTRKDNKLKDSNIGGIYIQSVVAKNKKITDTKDVLLSTIAYKGYSSSSIKAIGMFDPSLGASGMIKGLKIDDKGNFDKKAKILSKEQMDELVKNVDEKIKNAIYNIYQGNFTINPKDIDGKDKSCNYCEYKDCCYKKYSDIVFIKKDGGEN